MVERKSMRKTVTVAVLVSVLFVWSGCGRNPTAPAPEPVGSVKVVVQNEKGIPLSGIQVVTFPNTAKKFTDVNGQVILQDIPPGKYQVALFHPTIPLTYQDIIIASQETRELTFTIASQVTISLLVLDTAGNPVEGIDISTDPITFSMTTNEKGCAVIENVPVQSYAFIVSRLGITILTDRQKLVIRNGQLEDVVLVIARQEPFVRILSPKNQDLQSNRDIHLTGEGYDFEDYELTGYSLVWSSDIDGFLGTGEELTIDYLSIGHHTIILTGIDSDNYKTARSIKLNLHGFEKDSYFPIPWKGSWIYHYENPVISVRNDDGEMEDWNFGDLEVTMEDLNTRNCSLHYSVITDNESWYYHYYIVDYFQSDEDNIYIAKTTERLRVWENISTAHDPTRELNLETEYFPRYPVIQNHMAPQVESFYEITVNAEVTWDYRDFQYGGNPYSETAAYSTSIETGTIEPVETGVGTFEAVPLTITAGEAVRKWWLARGIGLVRLEYNTFDLPLTAILYETNIFEFSDDGLIHKLAAGSHRTGSQGVVKRFSKSADTPEGMWERCAFLRDLCPR